MLCQMLLTRRPRPLHSPPPRPEIRRSRPLAMTCCTAALVGLVAIGLAGCASDTAPAHVGAPATGLPTDPLPSAATKVFFLTANGPLPVWRGLGATVDPQAALDALAQGPQETERSRGISTALPSTNVELTATASNGRVDIDVPWNISTLEPQAVAQMACTAASAPGIPGNLDSTEVLVVFHEPVDPLAGFDVRCDADANVNPVRDS